MTEKHFSLFILRGNFSLTLQEISQGRCWDVKHSIALVLYPWALNHGYAGQWFHSACRVTSYQLGTLSLTSALHTTLQPSLVPITGRGRLSISHDPVLDVRDLSLTSPSVLHFSEPVTFEYPGVKCPLSYQYLMSWEATVVQISMEEGEDYTWAGYFASCCELERGPCPSMAEPEYCKTPTMRGSWTKSTMEQGGIISAWPPLYLVQMKRRSNSRMHQRWRLKCSICWEENLLPCEPPIQDSKIQGSVAITQVLGLEEDLSID